MPSLGPRVEPIIEAEPIRLGRADHGRPVSHAEFASASYDEPWKYERVDGRLSVLSPDGKNHVRTTVPWSIRLGAYMLAHLDYVQAVVSNAWVLVDGENERIADLAVYLNGRLDDIDIPHQAPDLLFEFVSPSSTDRRRDYVEKRTHYERAGVREYVIVDRFDRKVTVLTLGPGGYAERVIPADGTYDFPLLPGFALPLADTWPN